jgi:hypothetical protein
MMEQEQIIPTRHKSKIPHTFSYPVGAKAISDALRGSPQFDRLIVDFYFNNQLARQHGTSIPYAVIDALYSGSIRFFSASRTIEEQSCDPRRMIAVHAIPRSLRHVIQAKVLVEALPAIRSWLVANPHASDREGSHGATFSFDELKNELLSEATASVLWQSDKADR